MAPFPWSLPSRRRAIAYGLPTGLKAFFTSPFGGEVGIGRVRGPFSSWVLAEGPLTRRYASPSPPKGEVWRLSASDENPYAIALPQGGGRRKS
jgi:hypothetical protein